MIRSKIQNPTIYHLSSIIYLSIIYLSIIYHLKFKIYNLKLKISRLLSKILALGSRFYQKVTLPPATAG